MATYKLSGKIKIEETLTGRDLLEDEIKSANGNPIRALQNVLVEISSSTKKKGGWNKWEKVRAGDDGAFEVEHDAKQKQRRFRVRVMLKDDDLHVCKVNTKEKPTLAPITAFKDRDQRNSDDTEIDFNDIIIRDPSPVTRVGRNEYRRAQMWYVLKKLQKRLEAENRWLCFNHRLNAVYPASASTTWASLNTIHITNNYYKFSTIIHEAMHIWNYQHNIGKANWLGSWFPNKHAISFSTHNDKENPGVAFHEGFASWASNEVRLMDDLWGSEPTDPNLIEIRVGPPDEKKPYCKKYLAGEPRVTNKTTFEKSEYGTITALKLLCVDDPYQYILGPVDSHPDWDKYHAFRIADDPWEKYSCPKAPAFTFWDILLAFKASPENGYPTDWDVSKKHTGIFEFIDRLSAIYRDRFDIPTKNRFVIALDPESDEELKDSCTTN